MQYQMNQPTMQIEYYKPKCRKDGDILPVGSKVPKAVWLVLLFVTFAFSSLFITKLTINSYVYAYTDIMELTDPEMVFYITLAMVSALDIAVLYIQIAIYNFIAMRYLHGEVPCRNRELFQSLLPFFVLRNFIWGMLSLLMFLPGGQFVSIGLASFEMLSTMIIIIPAFYALKKRYIKQGYSRDIFTAYFVPFTILQAVFLIF